MTFSPSEKIFVNFQLKYICGNFVFVSEPENADFIVGTGSKFVDWVSLNHNLYTEVKFILFKPHLEIDIRLKSKKIWDAVKSTINRIFLSILNIEREGLLEKLRSFDLVVADNQRLFRTLRNGGVNVVYLPLIYFEKMRVCAPIKNYNYIKIAVFGEATHLSDLIKELLKLDRLIMKETVEIIYFGYGPLDIRNLQNKLKNLKISKRDFSFNFEELCERTNDISFSICSHRLIESDYFKKSIFKSLNQPNEVFTVEKFSSNTGRNHLSALLGLPFITHNLEEIFVEFPWLSYDYVFEGAEDLLWFIKNCEKLCENFIIKNQTFESTKKILNASMEKSKIMLGIN